MVRPVAWSYSKLKTFQQCPKKYYHLYVLRDIVEAENDAMRYGNRFHKAAELYVAGEAELPKEFDYAKEVLDRLSRMKGEILCEKQFALDVDLNPCKFLSKKVWWRGIADLLIIKGRRAIVLDYKTGKNTRYADKGQLELMALGTFKHYPDVEEVNAGLLFVRCDEFITDKYTTADAPKLWAKWLSDYMVLETAHKKDVWNPKESGLCKAHCPVTSCIHNGFNRS